MTIVTHSWAPGRPGEVSKAFFVEYHADFLIILCGYVVPYGCSLRTSDRGRPNFVKAKF
jgi:hypothetical protein